MTERDDGDDPQLQSLRAVWLTMPDENPPERGLAELMAAARMKADEMATPSLWQRISALLRRPPVLALATVLVLIGGAVFIGQRRDTMQSAPEIAVERSRVEAHTTAAPAGAPAQGSSAMEATEPTLDEPTLAEPMIPEPAFEPEPKAEAPRLTRRPSPTKPANVDTGLVPPRDERAPLAAKKSDAGDKAFGSLVRRETQAPAAKPAAEKADNALTASDSVAAPQAAAVPETVVEETSSTRGAGAPKVGAATTTATPSSSRAAQYLAQAKAALARGDCATARTLLKRVASEDAASYRKALASDASLNSCVTAAQ